MVLSIGLLGSRTTPIFAHAASLNSQVRLNRSLAERFFQLPILSARCCGK
jgi:hypothetical protein